MLGVRAAPWNDGEHPRKRHRGMVSGPAAAVTTTAAVSDREEHNNNTFVTSDSPPRFFIKDGRKIQVGDCALFQAGHAPPFIGIIRRFPICAVNHLNLGVNLLYRSTDVKLGKHILLEAAPNEVFYSFHCDEVPAASLLHPCKVAFLREGVELPSGLSSFVCRRVYDIENKCLWWLSDQDYINELQEEVNQLLDKTRLEMHASQSGGRSPKTLNGLVSSQVKSGSGTAQNNGKLDPTHIKGKKRERREHSTEIIKQESNSKFDDGDSVKVDMIKAEISKIIEKGGLVNVEAVESLVHLMQLDKADRKIDLSGKVMLADVIAATDKLDCLARFIQLRGVPILDGWLQEAHKGRTGDGSSPKEGDKSMEELLLALLRALDKLPVNLSALQTSHIGKSVNNLRSHKNLDIQRKARSLVDTWKKRVDAEMVKISDAKSAGPTPAVSWPAKPGFPEASQGGNRRACSTDIMWKSSIIQPSTCKAAVPSRPGNFDVKISSTSPGTLKLPSALLPPISLTTKDSSSKIVGSTSLPDVPSVTAEEEKIGNSGQFQNSQSFSGDHGKVVSPFLKDDAKSSAGGSMSTSKMASGLSRHRRSSNGFAATTTGPGISREMSIGKSPNLSWTPAVDKASHSTLASDRTLDLPVSDRSNSHRLIVRLPNPGRSPARSNSGGFLEEQPAAGVKASSPANPDKHDLSDRKLKLRSDVTKPADRNTEASPRGDAKEGPASSDDLERSPGSAHDEDCSKTSNDAGRPSDSSKPTCPSAINEKEVLLPESKLRNPLSSIDALIGSCAKFSESGAPLSEGDVVGMNLLASVAAEEISRSNLSSPADSPRSSLDAEGPWSGTFRGQVRSSPDASVAQSQGHNEESPDGDLVKDANKLSSAFVKDGLKVIRINSSSDKNSSASSEEENLAGQRTQQLVSASTSQFAIPCVKSDGKIEDGEVDRCIQSSTSPAGTKKEFEGTSASELRPKLSRDRNDFSDCKQQINSQLLDDKEQITFSQEKTEDSNLCSALNAVSGTKQDVFAEDKKLAASNRDAQKTNPTGEGSGDTSLSEKQAIAAPADGKSVSKNEDAVPCGDVQSAILLVNANEANNDKPDSAVDRQLISLFSNGVEEVPDTKNAFAQNPRVSTNPEEADTLFDHESEKQGKYSSQLLITAEEGKMGLTSSAVATNAQPALPDAVSKLDFDLNEGFPGDEGNQGDQFTRAQHSIDSHSSLDIAVSRITNVLQAQMTVASPAKRPFVPPENLLKSKPEPGWKGSAATSAFRLAEPRKVLEMPLNAPEIPSSDYHPGKQTRPLLHIDLNVPDDRVIEDIGSHTSSQTACFESEAVSNCDVPTRLAAGFDLDLNKADEGADNGQFFANNSHKVVEVPLVLLRPVSGGLPHIDYSLSRGFDLNGPGVDEIGTDPGLRGQHAKTSGVSLIHPFAGIRMNNAELGKISSCFPPGNSYSAVAMPAFLPERGEQPYSVIPAGVQTYRNPVLSSSPAMAFSHATACPYAGYPAFPLPSSSFSGCTTTFADSSIGGPCFATIPSQLVGPASVVSSSYAWPCVMSVPESSAGCGSEGRHKVSRQGLDLNSGPGSVDAEGDRLGSAVRQLPVVTSQSDDHARIYHVRGGGLKRKEPDRGWDVKQSTYRQPSWQ